MKYEKINKNLLLLLFFIFYVWMFLFSAMHLDFSRDVRQAFDILNKYNYPLTGDSYKVRDLVQEIVAVNPKIFNNIQWH